MSRLPYPTEETKIARWPLLVRRARAMQRREQHYSEHLDRGPAARKYSGTDRAGDWIEQACESAACDIAPAQEFGS